MVMSKTLVVQSHRSVLPYRWINRCLESVRNWCELNRYEYRFLNDELYEYLPADIRKKLTGLNIIASDLARIIALKNALSKDYETVLWLDADFLIFNPGNFVLPIESYAVGREVWVQYDKQGKLRVYSKVHNAFLMFRRTNGFLDFYVETSERLLRQNKGGMPPQFIGPKLLTALHNVTQLPVMESAGMLSPLVIQDIVRGGGEALEILRRYSPYPLAGANLCTSSRDRGEVTCTQMERVIDVLIDKGMVF